MVVNDKLGKKEKTKEGKKTTLIYSPLLLACHCVSLMRCDPKKFLFLELMVYALFKAILKFCSYHRIYIYIYNLLVFHLILGM